MKNTSIRKNQLQVKIDGVKSQYTSLLTDMQKLQSKLAEGQEALQKLSEDYMRAVNQTPTLRVTLPAQPKHRGGLFLLSRGTQQHVEGE